MFRPTFSHQSGSPGCPPVDWVDRDRGGGSAPTVARTLAERRGEFNAGEYSNWYSILAGFQYVELRNGWSAVARSRRFMLRFGSAGRPERYSLELSTADAGAGKHHEGVSALLVVLVPKYYRRLSGVRAACIYPRVGNADYCPIPGSGLVRLRARPERGT